VRQVFVVAAAVGCLSTVSLASEPHSTRLRGLLTWNADRQTLTPCGNADVYWVRVLASNPHFHLSQRVDKLSTATPSPAILADLEGIVSSPPSAGPDYPIDHVLEVREIHSVELGKCE
jgi:hypothetical protein